MSHSYGCHGFSSRDACQDIGEQFDGLNELIEHIRRKHILSIRRSSCRKLGSPDDHGHIWYCFQCEGKGGKDHKSFGSGSAMWDHLNDKHDDQLPSIVKEEEL